MPVKEKTNDRGPEDERGSRTKRRNIKQAQDIVARHSRKGSDPVTNLIAERRKEAERE